MSEYRLDGITERDLHQIAEWRNAQRDVLRTPGFTHQAMQRDWLIEMRKAGGLVAAIRGDGANAASARIGQGGSSLNLFGYVALYPLHGDYAELGWLHGEGISDKQCVHLGIQFARASGLVLLHGEGISDKQCVHLGIQFARASGLVFLIAETRGKGGAELVSRRDALETARFYMTGGIAHGEHWGALWSLAL